MIRKFIPQINLIPVAQLDWLYIQLEAEVKLLLKKYTYAVRNDFLMITSRRFNLQPAVVVVRLWGLNVLFDLMNTSIQTENVGMWC